MSNWNLIWLLPLAVLLIIAWPFIQLLALFKCFVDAVKCLPEWRKHGIKWRTIPLSLAYNTFLAYRLKRLAWSSVARLPGWSKKDRQNLYLRRVKGACSIWDRCRRDEGLSRHESWRKASGYLKGLGAR